MNLFSEVSLSVEEFVNNAFQDIHLTSSYEIRRGKTPFVLGIGAFSHDTSAAIVNEETGEVIFAQAEERNSNFKHDSTFPIQAIVNGIKRMSEYNGRLSSIAINFDPNQFLYNGFLDYFVLNGFASHVQVMEQLIHDLVANQLNSGFSAEWRFGEQVFKLLSQIPGIENHRDWVQRSGEWYLLQYRKGIFLKSIVENLFPSIPVTPIRHHLCHAASTYYNFKGSETMSVVVIDGHGETDTCTVFSGDRLSPISETKWPVSLGSLYLTSTRYIGFDYGDEFKVMGMSAYGRPKYLDIFESAFRFDMRSGHLKYENNPYILPKFVGRSGQVRYEFTEEVESLVPKCKDANSLQQVHFDFAASIQKFTELTGLDFALFAKETTGCSRIGIAGGVGLNGLMNQAIRDSGEFDAVHVYPAAGDDGTSVGAAQFVVGKVYDKSITSIYLGSSYEQRDVQKMLHHYSLEAKESINLHQEIADLLFQGKIVARFTGRSEFGPRALGNRSILANPTVRNMKDILNSRIKHREEFRPFAPAVPLNRVSDFFEFDSESPFMLFIPKARRFLKDMCPAIVHNDNTARIQTVTEEDNPDFYKIIAEFEKLCGVPVILNTSFNLNGETIVDTPQDAIESFLFMDIDFLAIDNLLVAKTQVALEKLGNFSSHSEFLDIRRRRYREGNPHPLKSLNCRKYGEWFYLN